MVFEMCLLCLRQQPAVTGSVVHCVSTGLISSCSIMFVYDTDCISELPYDTRTRAYVGAGSNISQCSSLSILFGNNTTTRILNNKGSIGIYCLYFSSFFIENSGVIKI